MNLTPDPRSLSDRTPFDSPPAPAAEPAEAPLAPAPLSAEDAAAQARAAEQAALEAKMALLPNYGDEAFPRPQRSRGRAGGERAQGAVQDSLDGAEAGNEPGFGPRARSADEAEPAGPIVAGGCLGGLVGNVLLGFALLGLQRAGLVLYGPGVLAVVVALVALALLAGSWPRRVWLAAAGFVLGLVLSFGLLFLFVRPAVEAARGSGSSAPAEAPGSPAVSEPGPAAPSDGLQPS